MTLVIVPSFFDQFSSPLLLGVPLVALSLTLPWLLFPTPATRWVTNPFMAIENWLISRLTLQLFTPVKEEGHKWAMILATLLIFLVAINLLGLLPYTFTATTQLSMNMALAVPLWCATLMVGLRKQVTPTLGHLLPEGAPFLMSPGLIIIETISLFIRPVALGVRLTANLTAGHLMMQLISTGAFVMLFALPAIAGLTMLTLTVLTLLETAVAMIQAYVFVLLTSLYLQENV
uniref:ATP synthase subunit a n=1 Tax=Eviota japonica TaxID=1828451 RepID=A0A5K7TNA0_9GOBI|nr:ATPase subunit 6 [Eviota japonica]